MDIAYALWSRQLHQIEQLSDVHPCLFSAPCFFSFFCIIIIIQLLHLMRLNHKIKWNKEREYEKQRGRMHMQCRRCGFPCLDNTINTVSHIFVLSHVERTYVPHICIYSPLPNILSCSYIYFIIGANLLAYRRGDYDKACNITHKWGAAFGGEWIR